MDKLAVHQAKFHRNKALQLEKEWETRKVAGEKKILKAEQELLMELDRIKVQIKVHKDKAQELTNQEGL